MGASPIVTTGLVPEPTPRLWPLLATLPASASPFHLLAALRTATPVRLEPMGRGVGLVCHKPLRLSGIGLSVGIARWLGHVLFRQRGALAGVHAVVAGRPLGTAVGRRHDGHRNRSAKAGDDRS
jgi:hypothetical protein